MSPLFTISIALFNNEKYIERCLLSAVNQLYKNLEIIIVNDGSTDSSLEIVKSIDDNRIIIINQPNEGLSNARQKALYHAKGEFISFIDGDDYLMPDYVEKMINRIQRDNSDICICGTIFEDEKGCLLEHDTKYFQSKDFVQPIYGDNVKDVKWLYLSDSWNKVYRTSFLIKNGVEFKIPKGLNGTDRAFNMKLFVHKPLYSSISDQCYIHVIYKQSAVHRKNKDLFKSYSTIIEQIEDECQKIGVFSKFINFLNVHYYLFLRSSFQDVYNESTFLKSIKEFHHIYERHRVFINNREYLKYPLMQGTKSNVIFLRLLYKYVFLLPIYFGIRRAVINKNK